MLCPHCGKDPDIICSVTWNEEEQIWIAESSQGIRLASKDHVNWIPLPKEPDETKPEREE